MNTSEKQFRKQQLKQTRSNSEHRVVELAKLNTIRYPVLEFMAKNNTGLEYGMAHYTIYGTNFGHFLTVI